MNALALIVIPALFGPVLGSRRLRPHVELWLVGVALVVATLAWFVTATGVDEELLGGLVRIDATSRLFLAFVNPIFVGVSFYVWSRVTSTPELRDEVGRFVPFALLFLAATNAVFLSNHLLVMWVALEATSLMAAPLIVRPNLPSSLRASFRYFVFSCVGLGLVLLGFVCLTHGLEATGHVPELFIDSLPEVAAASANRWGALGVGLIILGLGTKLGLAPMYSWLPEAYDEAPPAVTALLGAVQFNAALVMLFRVVQAFRPTHGELVTGELVVLGLTSMVVSTFSVIATRNLKRLVAYASINHAGVIAIGLGIGKAATYGLMLYVISNAFIKAILFLTAGKIKAHYGTKDTRQISGLIKDLPYSGVFLMVGTFALLGFPPFGSFFGELLILSALVGSGHIFVFAAFCVLITMTFVATGRTIFPMIWGESKQARTWPRQTFWMAAPKLFFLAVLVVLGIYIPPMVNDLIQQVAAALGAS